MHIEQDEDYVFIGSVPTILSCYAQGKTQEKMLKNLKEVLRLCLRNNQGGILEKIKSVIMKNLKIACV